MARHPTMVCSLSGNSDLKTPQPTYSNTVGITGNAGTGKSYLCQMIRELGYSVFDADQINADLYQEPPVQTEILKLFPEAAMEEGLDKKRVAQIAFHDPDRRAQLENLMIPLIQQRLQYIASRQHGLLFYEASLIFEKKAEKNFLQVWCTTCSPVVQEKRLQQRGYDQERINNLQQAQMPQHEKAAKADWVICTDEDLRSASFVESLKERIDSCKKKSACYHLHESDSTNEGQ